MDDGSGDFSDIHGFASDTLALDATIPAEMGKTYSFRYRIKNIYGWSDFSQIGFILAADVPLTPQKPQFISATDNTITLQFCGETIKFKALLLLLLL